MATRHPPRAVIATPSIYILYLSLFTILAVATLPALATPPSTIEFYIHENTVPPNATRVEVASPSGDLTATEFGSISVLANPIRETAAADSLLLGLQAGQVITEKDLSEYVTLTWVLNTTSFVGSISAQGTGGLAVVGGTGDFRFVRGYSEATFISQDPRDRVLRVVLHLKYD